MSHPVQPDDGCMANRERVGRMRWMRAVAGLVSVAVVGACFYAAIYWSKIRPPLQVSAQIQAEHLTFRIPPKTLELLEIGPSSTFGVRIVGMTVIGRGLEGRIGLQHKEVPI